MSHVRVELTCCCKPWERVRACSASGTVSPRWMMVRSAWMSGVWNSCPRSLNSVAWHLHVPVSCAKFRP